MGGLHASFAKPFEFKVTGLDKIESGMAKVASDIKVATVAMSAFNREASRTPKAPRSPLPPRSPGAPRIPRAPRSRSTRPASPFREAGESFRRSYREMAHPFYSSPAFVAMTGLTTAIVGLKESIESAAKIDTATTKLEMFGGMSPAEAIAARSKALKDSLDLGVGAETIIGSQAQAMRAGLSKELGTVLGDLIPKAAAAMGEPAEKLAESLGEAVTQGISMGLIKGPDGVRRFMNVTAGMSNFGGMSPQKMDQFWASGGMGAGKSMGWDSTDTAGMASVFGSMGSRTGQFDARFIGYIANVVPFLKDRYMRAARGPYSEENSALLTAPQRLGYGNVDNMSDALMGGPEGVVDFFSRIAKLHNEKLQRQILKSVGFGQQGLAVVAEVGENPEKALAAIKQARDLSKQGADADYLTQSFAKWRSSLVFMISQIEAGFKAIKAELGDVVKDDLIAPFRDIWVDTVKGLLDGGLRQRFHNDLLAFVNGLGFRDVATLLSSIKAHAGTFDAAGFLKGLGEGIRSIVDAMRSVVGVFSFLSGSGDGEVIGKVAAQFFAVALAAHALAPIVQVFTALATFLRGVRLALSGFKVLELTGLAASLKSLTALPFAEAAAGLARFLGPLATMIGLAGLAEKKGILQAPKGLDGRSILEFLDPGLADRVYGKRNASPQVDGATVQKQSFTGSGIDPAILHRAAFMSEDTPVGRAIINTDVTVAALLDATTRTGNMVLASTGGGGWTGSPSSGMSGVSGGQDAPGSYVRSRGMPDSNGSLDKGDDRPTTALGKTGAKFKGKAPAIMAGLMKRYGLTREQAAGIVGNLAHESAGFTAFHEGGKAPGKGGVGWAQWTGSRRRKFEAWTKAHGLDPTSDEASWRYLTEGDPETKAAIAAVKKQHTVHGAARAFEQTFERAGVKAYGSRERFADQANAMGPSDNGVGSITGTDPKSVAASVAPTLRKGRHAPTITNNIVIQDATDPHRVGAAVQKHIDRTIDYRTHDVEFDV